MPLSPCQPGWEEWVISHMGNVRPTPARPPTMPRTPCFTSRASRPSSPPDQVVSQGVRCRQMFGGQRSAIFRQPSDVEKLLVIQAGSAIGRRALSTLPLSPRYTLTGHEMRTAFHVRTLAHHQRPVPEVRPAQLLVPRRELPSRKPGTNRHEGVKMGHRCSMNPEFPWTPWEFDRMSRTIAVSLARSRGIDFQA